jgi:cysteine desulfurase
MHAIKSSIFLHVSFIVNYIATTIMYKNLDIKKKVIYFDNNGTTIADDKVIELSKNFAKSYNASTDARVVQHSKRLIEDTKKQILQHCNADENKYEVVFVSGGSESNSFLIKSTSMSFKKMTGMIPHIITSSFEHDSNRRSCESLKDAGLIECDFIDPNTSGLIHPEDIEKKIKKNTALISIMYANNEIGSINNCPLIGEIAHKHKIPFHSDCVQIFGKHKLDMEKNNIDAISVSMHKLYGMKGIGFTIIKKEFIEGYNLTALIEGTQNNNLRGGTYNTSLIVTIPLTIKLCFKNREKKNAHLLNMRNQLIEGLSKILPIMNYAEFYEDKRLNVDEQTPEEEEKTIKERNLTEQDNLLLIIGPTIEKKNSCMCNTLMIACITYDKPFCNVEMKKMLDKKNVVISIGSACLTKNAKSSHVLNSIKASKLTKRGVMRISFGDQNTEEEVEKFLKIFKSCYNALRAKNIKLET